MPQPDHISALPVADPEALGEDLRELFALCTEKLGIVPNVLRAYSPGSQKLRNFVVYNELMLASSGLSKLEREMIAVVASSANRCYYCLVAHGQAVRRLAVRGNLSHHEPEVVLQPGRIREEIGPLFSLTDQACDVSL